MADFGATDLDAFRAQTKAWLAANYPPALKDPKTKVDPEAMWGRRAPSPAARDPHIQWIPEP